MKKYVITVGKNVNGKQLIDDREFQNITINILKKNEIYEFTLINCLGGYVYNDEKCELEKSLKIEILSMTTLYLSGLIQDLKIEFKQECIMLEKNEIDVSFL